jgi:hypothetical protein
VLVLGQNPDNSISTITTSRAFLDDTVNWVGGRLSDAISAIGHAASSVVSFVMDGAKLAIKIMVSGVEYLYTGIVDTIHKAMDAIACVLDYAGTKLGEAANWLLEKLGFLDWDGIKAKRDEIRLFIKNNMSAITQWMPNPVTAANTIVSQLSSLQANLNTYKSLASSSTALSSQFSLAGGLPSLIEVGGKVGLSKLNWLTDKVESAFFSLDNSVFGIPQVRGMRQATDALEATVGEAMDFLPAMLHSFDNAAGHWLDSTASFVDRTATALVDILLDQVDRIIQLIQKLVVGAADAIGKLLAHPEAILAWMDAKLSIPFFSSFYHGFTHNDLSFFDVACLAAAICSPHKAPGPRSGNTSRAAVDTQLAGEIARSFMYAGNVTNALDSSVSAVLPGTPYSTGTSILNMASMLGVIVSTLVEKGDRWYDIAAAAGGVLAVALYGVYNKLFVIVGQALLTVLRVALTIVDAINREGRSIAYDLVGTFQGFLALVVNIATTEWKRRPIVENGLAVGTERYKFDITRKPLDPIRSAVHGAIQYYLGAIGYNVHTGQPLINVLP